MKRNLNPIKPYRLVETEWMPGGGGGAHCAKPAKRPLRARWVVAEEGRLICQWTSE
jgi:hypothetical protein